MKNVYKSCQYPFHFWFHWSTNMLTIQNVWENWLKSNPTVQSLHRQVSHRVPTISRNPNPKLEKFCSYIFLKNLAPLFPMPVPARLADNRDLVSGLHFNSLRTENKAERAGVTSLIFILLHDSTLTLSSIFHERITDSRPCVVSSEQPSRDSNFTLLWKGVTKLTFNQVTFLS